MIRRMPDARSGSTSKRALVERPQGAKRGAYYTSAHLEQLLRIRKWQQAGLTLERIRKLVAGETAAADLPPEPPRRPGDVSVRSHILLAPGVELVIEPRQAGLAPEACGRSRDTRRR